MIDLKEIELALEKYYDKETTLENNLSSFYENLRENPKFYSYSVAREQKRDQLCPVRDQNDWLREEFTHSSPNSYSEAIETTVRSLKEILEALFLASQEDFRVDSVRSDIMRNLSIILKTVLRSAKLQNTANDPDIVNIAKKLLKMSDERIGTLESYEPEMPELFYDTAKLVYQTIYVLTAEIINNPTDSNVFDSRNLSKMLDKLATAVRHGFYEEAFSEFSEGRNILNPQPEISPTLIDKAIKYEKDRSRTTDMEGLYNIVLANLEEDPDHYNFLLKGNLDEMSSMGGGAVAGAMGVGFDPDPKKKKRYEKSLIGENKKKLGQFSDWLKTPFFGGTIFSDNLLRRPEEWVAVHPDGDHFVDYQDNEVKITDEKLSIVRPWMLDPSKSRENWDPHGVWSEWLSDYEIIYNDKINKFEIIENLKNIKANIENLRAIFFINEEDYNLYSNILKPNESLPKEVWDSCLIEPYAMNYSGYLERDFMLDGIGKESNDIYSSKKYSVEPWAEKHGLGSVAQSHMLTQVYCKGEMTDLKRELCKKLINLKQTLNKNLSEQQEHDLKIFEDYEDYFRNIHKEISGEGKAPAKFWKDPFWVGAVFSNSNGDEFMLEPEFDFININYDTIEVPDDEILEINPYLNIDNKYSEIRSDYEITMVNTFVHYGGSGYSIFHNGQERYLKSWHGAYEYFMNDNEEYHHDTHPAKMYYMTPSFDLSELQDHEWFNHGKSVCLVDFHHETEIWFYLTKDKFIDYLIDYNSTNKRISYYVPNGTIVGGLRVRYDKSGIPDGIFKGNKKHKVPLNVYVEKHGPVPQYSDLKQIVNKYFYRK